MNRVVLDSPIYIGGEEEEEDPLDAFLLSDAPAAPAAQAPLDLDALMLEDSPDVQARNQSLREVSDIVQPMLAERPAAPPRQAARPAARPAPAAAPERAPSPRDSELEAAERKGRERAVIASLGRAFNRAFGSESQDQLLAQMQADSDQPVKELMRRREQQRADRATARTEAREDEAMGLAAQRRDPASPVNQRFQQAIRSRFSGLVPDEVIAQMTVEDQESLGLMGAAQAARERTQAMTQARQNELADMASAQQGRIDLENLDHTNRIALEDRQNVERANRARIMAGRNAGAQSGPLAEAMRLRMRGQQVPDAILDQLSPRDINRLDNVSVPRAPAGELTPAQQLQEQRYQASEERARRADARALGDRLSSSGVLEAQGVLDRAESELGRADDTGFRAAAVAPGWAPDALLPGRNSAPLREALAQVRNITLKDRSGAAISNAEFDRLKEELGTGALQSREAVMRGLRRLRQIQRDHQATIESGFDPQTVDTYHGRRSTRLGEGAPAPRGGAPAPQPAGPTEITVSNGTETFTIPASDLEEARADGFEPVGRPR